MFSRRRTTTPFLRIIAMLAIGALAFFQGHTLAQEPDPELSYSLAMIASGEAVADIPDGTVRITVYSEDQSVEYGNCVMSIGSKPSGCSVQVPPETTVMAVLDETTLPEGIGVVESTIAYTTPAEVTQVGDIWFEFVYADNGVEPSPPAGPGPVNELPETGSGPLSNGTHGAGYALAATASLLAGAATIARRLATQ